MTRLPTDPSQSRIVEHYLWQLSDTEHGLSHQQLSFEIAALHRPGTDY